MKDAQRALIVILWRAGLRIQEALALARPISMSEAALCSSGDEREVGVARPAWDACCWEELERIDNAEIIETVHARRKPMIPVSTYLSRRRRSQPVLA